MNLDGDTLGALGFGDAVDMLDEDGHPRFAWGWRVWRLKHRDRVPKPRLVSQTESNRRWLAKTGRVADEAARKREERAGWSPERRERERQAVRERRARKAGA